MEKKIIGYKRNPNMNVSAAQLAGLLSCNESEEEGLFFWGCHFSENNPVYRVISRAVELNIIGEDKILIPVYEEEKPVKQQMSLNEYIQKYIDSDYDLPLNEGIWEFNKLHSDYLVVHKSQVK